MDEKTRGGGGGGDTGLDRHIFAHDPQTISSFFGFWPIAEEQEGSTTNTCIITHTLISLKIQSHTQKTENPQGTFYI
jgi:hypothetical protein